MLRLSLIISVLSLSTSLVSFLNQLLIARFFGAGPQLDRYLIAVSVPTMATGAAAGLFAYAIVPVFVRRRIEDPAGYRGFFGALTLCFAAIGAAAAGLSYPLCPWIVSALAPGLSADQAAFTVVMARIAWLSMGASLVVGALTAAQNASRRFIAPVVAGAFQYLGMIGMMLLFHGRLGTECLPIGVCLGAFASVAVLYAGVADEFSFRPGASGRWRECLAVLGGVPLIAISMLCFTVYGTIDAFWGARLSAGDVSYLGYGQRLLIAFGNVVVLGPSTVLSPVLAEAAAKGDSQRFRAVAGKAVRMALALASPCAAVLALTAAPMVRLVFQRGAFDAAATQGVSFVLPGLFCGMVPMLGVVLLMKGLHARGDVRGAAAIGGGAAALYFALSGVLSRKLGVLGISCAYALGWWLTFAACAARVFDARAVATAENARFALRLAVSLSVAVAALAAARAVLPAAAATGRIQLAARLAAIAGAGALGFFATSAVFFRMEEVLALRRLLPGRRPEPAC